MIIVHGIKNCDTVQRALRRLTEAGIAYRFHDFKTEGLPRELAQSWIDALGLDLVLNRKGTTWRKLDEATREGVTAANAAALLSTQPSLVKRPVIVKGEADTDGCPVDIHPAERPAMDGRAGGGSSSRGLAMDGVPARSWVHVGFAPADEAAILEKLG